MTPRRILVGIGLFLAILCAVPIGAFIFGFVHRFYIPSESMLPTLQKGDRFVAWMRAPDPLRRGEVVLFAAPSGATFIQRIAGLPGDRIAVRGGVIILNGAPVAQRLVRNERLSSAVGVFHATRRLAEQFPGEAAPHEIYDSGDTEGDEVAEVMVPPGHVFMLGDNRDNSADSRFADGVGAGGPVPIARIQGVPWFFY